MLISSELDQAVVDGALAKAEKLAFEIKPLEFDSMFSPENF